MDQYYKHWVANFAFMYEHRLIFIKDYILFINLYKCDSLTLDVEKWKTKINKTQQAFKAVAEKFVGI